MASAYSSVDKDCYPRHCSHRSCCSFASGGRARSKRTFLPRHGERNFDLEDSSEGDTSLLQDFNSSGNERISLSLGNKERGTHSTDYQFATKASNKVRRRKHDSYGSSGDCKDFSHSDFPKHTCTEKERKTQSNDSNFDKYYRGRQHPDSTVNHSGHHEYEPTQNFHYQYSRRGRGYRGRGRGKKVSASISGFEENLDWSRTTNAVTLHDMDFSHYTGHDNTHMSGITELCDYGLFDFQPDSKNKEGRIHSLDHFGEGDKVRQKYKMYASENSKDPENLSNEINFPKHGEKKAQDYTADDFSFNVHGERQSAGAGGRAKNSLFRLDKNHEMTQNLYYSQRGRCTSRSRDKGGKFSARISNTEANPDWRDGETNAIALHNMDLCDYADHNDMHVPTLHDFDLLDHKPDSGSKEGRTHSQDHNGKVRQKRIKYTTAENSENFFDSENLNIGVNLSKEQKTQDCIDDDSSLDEHHGGRQHTDGRVKRRHDENHEMTKKLYHSQRSRGNRGRSRGRKNHVQINWRKGTGKPVY